jgi:hypothetical protein
MKLDRHNSCKFDEKSLCNRICDCFYLSMSKTVDILDKSVCLYCHIHFLWLVIGTVRRQTYAFDQYACAYRPYYVVKIITYLDDIAKYKKVSYSNLLA